MVNADLKIEADDWPVRPSSESKRATGGTPPTETRSGATWFTARARQRRKNRCWLWTCCKRGLASNRGTWMVYSLTVNRCGNSFLRDVRARSTTSSSRQSLWD